MLVAGYNPVEAYGALFRGVFSKPKYIATVVIRATPIILTGISFIVAFRSGIFNIGGEGQYIVGTIAAVIVGSKLSLPPGIHMIAALLVAFAAAALAGALIGILKTKFGVHEVISCVMFNWLMFYLNNYMITLSWLKKPGGIQASIETLPSSWSLVARAWKFSPEGITKLANSSSPFAEMLLKTDLNWGIAIAIFVAICVHLLFKKTVKGYEFRAVGANPNASRLAGIHTDRITIQSMAISAAISGLAGGLMITGVMPHRIAQLQAMEGYGFAGIAVALIGGNSPIGSVFAGLFYSALTYGGASIQTKIGAPGEIITIVIGAIVYAISISAVFTRLFGKRDLIRERIKRAKEPGSVKGVGHE